MGSYWDAIELVVSVLTLVMIARIEINRNIGAQIPMVVTLFSRYIPFSMPKWPFLSEFSQKWISVPGRDCAHFVFGIFLSIKTYFKKIIQKCTKWCKWKRRRKQCCETKLNCKLDIIWKNCCIKMLHGGILYTDTYITYIKKAMG